MTIYQARVTVGMTDYTDAGMSVLSRDEADLATIGTDFIFDAINPASYAGGVLPTVGQPIPVAGLVNLARDTQPGLAGIERGAVTARPPAPTATMPVFDGTGLAWTRGTTAGLEIGKAGVSADRILQPKIEGFVDFVEIYIAMRTAAVFGGISKAGSASGGVQVSETGSILTVETSAVMGTMAIGVPTLVCKICRFDVAGDTSRIVPIIGAGGLVQKGATLVGKKPSTYPDSGYSRATIGAADGGTGQTFPGSLAYAAREYIGRSRLTDDDVLARAQRLFTYVLRRWA